MEIQNKDDNNQAHQRLLAFVVHIIDTMHLLGITFILYLLKLSAGNGFWKPITNPNKNIGSTNKFFTNKKIVRNPKIDVKSRKIF